MHEVKTPHKSTLNIEGKGETFHADITLILLLAKVFPCTNASTKCSNTLTSITTRFVGNNSVSLLKDGTPSCNFDLIYCRRNLASDFAFPCVLILSCNYHPFTLIYAKMLK